MNLFFKRNTAKRAALIFATGLFASVGVQAKEINLQQAMVDQCVAEIKYLKVADAKTAKKLCTCTTKVQADNLKLGEFWQMQSYAMSGKNPHQLAAVKRIEPKLTKCRKGLVLKDPQLPKPKQPKK